MELTGERILLREFAMRYTLLAIHSDSRVLRYYAPEVARLEHVQMLVEMFIAWAKENPRQNFQLTIVDLLRRLRLGDYSRNLGAVQATVNAVNTSANKRLARTGQRLIC